LSPRTKEEELAEQSAPLQTGSLSLSLKVSYKKDSAYVPKPHFHAEQELTEVVASNGYKLGRNPTLTCFFATMAFFYVCFLTTKFGLAVMQVVVGGEFVNTFCEADISMWIRVNGAVNLLHCSLILCWHIKRWSPKEDQHHDNNWSKPNNVKVFQFALHLGLFISCVWGSYVVFNVYGEYGWGGAKCPNLLYHFAIVYIIVVWASFALRSCKMVPYVL
jgi:hypothetical protein